MELTETHTDTGPLPEEDPSSRGFLRGRLGGGRRELLFWTLHSLFWANIGLVGYFMMQVYRPALADASQSLLQRVLTGFVMTALLRGCYRHPALRHRHGPAKWTLVLGLSLGASLLEPLLYQTLLLSFTPPATGLMAAASYRMLVVRLSVILCWNVLYFGFHLVEKVRQLQLRALQAEAARRQSDLRHLQSQLNPHFLFNALNTVLASKDNPLAVEEVTQSLADFLRLSLQETRPLEPLGRELGMIEKYLTVQHSRFGPNLVCQIECDTAARAILVPPMLIQPLLENAFNHGPKTGTLPLHVRVTVRCQPDGLQVTVANTGSWIPPRRPDPARPGTGIDTTPGTGIASLRQRLQLLLGDQANLTLDAGGGWVRALVFIPVRDRTALRTTEEPA